MLQPEDDFPSWMSLFLESIKAAGDYKLLIPSYCGLIQSLIDPVNSRLLPAPLTDQTTKFLSECIPQSITKVLGLGFLSTSEATMVFDYLKSTSDLIAWALENDVSGHMKTICRVIYPDCLFYERNGVPAPTVQVRKASPTTSTYWKGVVAHFIGQHSLQRIADRCLRPDSQLVHFDCLFAFVGLLRGRYEGHVDFDEKPVITRFLEFVDDLDISQLRDIDQTLYQNVFQNAAILVDQYALEYTERLLASVEKVMMSELLDRQLVAAQILSQFAQSSPAASAFHSWASRTRLGSYLIERDLHIELLQRLELFFVHLMTPELLAKFWQATMSAHISQRAKMLSIIARSIRWLDEDDVVAFLGRVSQQAMTDPEILQFLAEVAEAFANTNEKIAREVTRRVFGKICQPEWQEKSNEILKILARAKVGRQDILRECKKRLQEPASQSFVVSVLKGFIRDGVNPVKKIRSAVVNAISVDLSDRHLLLDLYGVSLAKANQPITLPILSVFLKTGSLDPVWPMLHKLFDSVGTDSIQPDGIACLVSILVNYDYHDVTSSFSLFLGSFLLILNVREGIIKPFGYSTSGVVKKIPSIFALTKLPIVQFELLVKAFITVDDENMSNRFRSHMLQLVRWTDNLSNEDLMRYLLASLKPGLEGTSLHKRRCLVFLKIYLTEVERGYDIGVFDASRHSDRTPRPVTSVFIANQNKQIVGELHISLTSSGHVLKNRVALAFDRDPNSFILKFQGQRIFEHRSLMDAELRNSQTVEVHDLPQNHRQAPPFILPSIVLANDNFQDVLIQTLSGDCDDALADVSWQLLQWLPSSTSLSFESSSGDNAYLTLYRLHLRLNHLRKLSINDVGPHVDALISKMVDHNDGFSDILRFFSERFYPEVLDFADRLIPFLLDLAAHTPDLWNTDSQTFLCEVIKADKARASEIVDANLNRFERMVLTHLVTSKFLDQIVSLLQNKQQLFLLCVKHIGDNPDPNMMRMLQIIAPLMDVQSDIGAVLDRCVAPLLTSHGKIFACLAQVVRSILASNPDLAQTHVDIIDQLLPRALGPCDNLTQKSIFALCQAISAGAELGITKIASSLEPFITFKNHRFSYRVNDDSRSSAGYVGLRNLGSTCYMNSILQQLFHTPAFCYSLLTSEFDGNEAHQAIQDIFAEMVLSQRRFADTEKFAKVWRGWGNMPINPREQQDASEFLQIFLDQFPSGLHSIYRGEIENKIEGVFSGFRTSNSESFYPLQLDIKGHENLTQSFNVFLEAENFTGVNRYRTTDDELIDARKSSRIKSAPPVLVLHLKRFIYDLRNWTRVKVHDRYAFPMNELNIKELLTTNSENVIYRLSKSIR